MGSSLMLMLLLSLLGFGKSNVAGAGGGARWQVLQRNKGIAAMHMQLLHNDRVIIFDRTDFGASNISLPKGICRKDPNDTAIKEDCTAHSVEYDVPSNSFRPLNVETDVWCSSGAAMPNGQLIQTGGFNDGERRVRIFTPCSPGSVDCDWLEVGDSLSVRRWYATNQLLPDGRQIIISGRRQYNYEYYPKTTIAPNVYSLAFLVETDDPVIENNLYPFVHLNVDGHLFIFANNRAILFDYASNKVIKTYPTIPGVDPRNYPSTGSSVLLPLRNLQEKVIEAEVLICGGAPKGSFSKVLEGTFVQALSTCARIKITDPNPHWVVEAMPHARVMSDMLLLPDGNVGIINGAAAGTAGWGYAHEPVLSPLIYRPDYPIGKRFQVQKPSSIPRMYHSTATHLRDGRNLVGGSNPNTYYNFTGVLFPTELRLEAFSPPYLDAHYAPIRPTILSPSSQTKITYGQQFTVDFELTAPLDMTAMAVNMVAPPFATHSLSMNQRLLVIGGEKVSSTGPYTYAVAAVAPRSGYLAPPGYYLIFVAHRKIPSEGIWIHIS